MCLASSNFLKALISICVFWSNVSLALDHNQLRNYIQQNFSNRLSLSDQQLDQLLWIDKHKRRSHDMEVATVDMRIHIEILRALSRLHCLSLLSSGQKVDYDQFVLAQQDANIKQPLSFSSFKKLSKRIKNLKPAEVQLLQTATILTAVSLSESAVKRTNNFNGLQDNQEFVATTVRTDPAIYPIVHADMQKLLYITFPPQTNFRHMLYTEGGIGMFKNLRTMIQQQYISQNELDMWYAYWIINIAGFRGHVQPQGSLYLTEPVFIAMDKLYNLIEQMLDTPNFNPLIPYLEFRAAQLGFERLQLRDKLTLTHIACLMRLYDIDSGYQLQRAYMQIPTQYKQQLQNYFNASLEDYQCPTPTHAPALFANSLALLDGNIEQTVKFVLPVYIQGLALQPPGQAVAFNQLSAVQNIRKLLDTRKSGISRVRVNTQGEVII